MTMDLPSVQLRAIERWDLPLLRDWRNALRHTHREWRWLNMIDQERWLERVTGRESTNLMMAVECARHAATVDPCTHCGLDVGSLALLGVVGLTYIDWPRRRAEASIYIGPEEARGAGFGTAALHALLSYGFDSLGLHRVYAEVYEYNTESLSMFERAGFRREGALRDHHFHEGRWIKSIVLGLLEDEWRHHARSS